MKRAVLTVVLCVMLLCAAAGVYAVDLRSGNTVVFSEAEPINEDILAAGNKVSIQPRVGGDVTAAGGNVTISGPVQDSVLAAGGNVTVPGSVGNDAWLAGGTINLSGPVSDNAYIAGGTININKGADVGQDLLVTGGSLNLLGNVGRNLRAAGSDISIGGTIGGNVYANSGSAIEVLDGALIRGNFIYQSPVKAKIAPGARILGEVRQTMPPKERKKPIFWPKFAWRFIGLLAAILFGIALILLFPFITAASAGTVRTAFLPSLGVGLLAAIVTPFAALLLMITVIGFPLAFALLAVYFVLLYAAKVFVAIALGRWILEKAGRTGINMIWELVIGLVALAIIQLIPFLGVLVWLVVVLTGLGAFILSWWRGRERTAPIGETPPPPAAPETPAV